MLCAGFLVAAKMASASGISNETAFLMQSYRFVAEPAMVSPSVRVAFPSFIQTACPPREYVPFGIPVAIMESLMRTMRSLPIMEKVARTTAP